MLPILMLTKAIELVAAGSTLVDVIGPLWKQVQKMQGEDRTEPTAEDLEALAQQVQAASDEIQNA